jgi:hypothetical protein
VKTHALWLSATKNLHFANAPFPRFSATEFAERMFVYNYRLYDRYRRPIASMAVLADEHKH